MHIRTSTIPTMLHLIQQRLQGDDVSHDLALLLQHKDYQVQFAFYNQHEAGIGFTESDFIACFHSLPDSLPAVHSIALRERMNDLLHVFNHLAYYQEKYLELISIDEACYQNALHATNTGLKSPLSDSAIEITITIGVGVSGGFNFNSNNFLDFVKSFCQKTPQGFLNTVSHELHHLGFKEQFTMDYSSYRLVDAFIHFFAGEGMAIKFGNQFEGLLTSRLSNLEHTYIPESYQYYLDNAHDIWHKFLDDLDDIFRGKYHNIQEIEELFEVNYFFRDVVIDGIFCPFYLKNPIACYLGADLWGLLYDQLSRDQFFNYLCNPQGVYKALLHHLPPFISSGSTSDTYS